VRIAAGFVVILGVLLVLAVLDGGNAVTDPQRGIVSSRSALDAGADGTEYTIYVHVGNQRAQVRRVVNADDEFVADCYSQAVTGAPLPRACGGVTVAARRTVRGLTTRDVQSALLSSALVLVALVLFAWRYVGVRGAALRSAGSGLAAVSDADLSDPSDAIALIQRADRARAEHLPAIERQAEVERRGRASWEAGRGAAVAFGVTALLDLTLGLQRASDVAFFTALLLFLSVAILYVLALASMLAQGEPNRSTSDYRSAWARDLASARAGL
jgi:hypothetical protein